MSSCSGKLKGANKGVFNALADNIGINQADAIYSIYNGFDREYDGDTTKPAYEFFKTTMDDRSSELFNEISVKDKIYTSEFQIAFSDDFRSKFKWVEAQKRLYKGEKFDVIAEEMKINPSDYHKKTFEPKLKTIENYSDNELSNLNYKGEESHSIILNTENEISDMSKKIINHYSSFFAKTYGVQVEFVDKTNIDKSKHNLKGWFNKTEKKIYMVNENMTLDTPIHEMFHPILEIFKRDNQEAYISLIRDLKQYKDRDWYKEVEARYFDLSPAKLYDELIVTAVGLEAKGLLKESTDENFKGSMKQFYQMVKEFFNHFNSYLKNKLDFDGNVIPISKLGNVTITDIATILVSDLEIEGVNKKIMDSALFYDIDGKAIDIDKIGGLDAFIEMNSQVLTENKEDVETEDTSDTDISTESERLKSSGEDKETYNQGVTNYKTESIAVADRYNSEKTAARAQYIRDVYPNFNNNKDKDLQSKDVTSFKTFANTRTKEYNDILNRYIETLESAKEKYKSTSKGVSLTPRETAIYKTFTDIEIDSNSAANIGTEIHKIQEYFFAKVNDSKGKDNKNYIEDEEFETIIKAVSYQIATDDDKQNEMIEDELRQLILFTKEIELANKGRKIEYKPELYIKSNKLKKQGVIDLAIIYDDIEYDIFDTKTKKRSFEKAWLNSFNNFDRDGMNHIAVSGKNETAVQAGIYSLIMQLEYPKLKLRNLGAIYFDININSEYDEETNTYGERFLDKIEIKKGKNGLHHLPLPDFRTDIVAAMGDDVRNLFIDKSSYSKDGANTITDMVSYLMDDKVLDSVDIKNASKRKLSYLDSNPKNADDKGLLDKTAKGEYVEDANALHGMSFEKYKFISFKDKTEQEQLDILSKYYNKINGKHKQFIDKVIEWQNTGIQPLSLSHNSRSAVAASAIIKSLGKDFILSKASSTLGMEDFADVPLLIAKNPLTGVSRLVYMSKDESKPITFLKGDKNRKTILGVDYEDKVVKTKYKDFKLREANTNNFRKILSGFAATRLKQLDNNFKVDRIFISDSYNSGVLPKPIDMTTIMPMLNVVKDNFKKEKAGYLNEIFNNEILFNPKNYKADHINIFKGILSTTTLMKNSRRDSVLDVLTSLQEEKVNIIEVIKELTSLEEEMRLAIGKDIELGDYNKHPEYIALMYMIQDLFKIGDQVVNGDVNKFHSLLSVEHNVPQHLRQSLIGIVKMFDNEIKRQFNDFEKSKEIVLKDMMVSKNISYNNAFISQSMIKSYDNLFQNKNDYNQAQTLMTLKDPENYNDKSINEEERKFIRFFNEKIYQSYLRLNPLMFQGLSEEKQREKVKGRVPIYKATPQSRQAKGIVKLKMNYTDDREVDTERDETTKFMMDNNFDSLMEVDTHKYNAGLDEDSGKMREGFVFDESVETNLEYIMQRFFTQGVEIEMHNYTLIAKRSMETMLKGQYFMYGNTTATESLIDDLDSSIDMYVRHETRQKGALNKRLEDISKAATTLAISMSLKQAVMDTLTYSLSSSAYLISNKIFSVFGGDKNMLGYFGMSSWAKAGRNIISNDIVTRRIMEDLAIDTSDSMLMGGDSRLKTMRKSVMEYGFIVTRNVGIASLTQVIVASMIEDGSFNAYSVDENGKLQYDETKDERFYKDGKLIEPEKLYAVKKLMYEEGGFNIEPFDSEDPKDLIDRKLLKGYSAAETNTIKAKAIQMLGSLDKDTRSRAEAYAIAKHALKFRSWLIAKKDLYMMDRQMSDTYQEWKKILQPDGSFKFELVPQETEGIIYSLASVYNKLMVYQLKVLNNGTVTDVEKKNLSIMATHVFFAAGIYALMSSLKLTCDEGDDCWLDDSQIGKSTVSMLTNVQSDMFIFATLYQIAFDTNSIFPGISLMISTTKRFMTSIFDMVYGEEKAPAIVHEFLKKSWATYRSGVEFSDIINYEGKGDSKIKNAGFNWESNEWDNFSFPIDDDWSSTYDKNTHENFPDM